MGVDEAGVDHRVGCRSDDLRIRIDGEKTFQRADTADLCIESYGLMLNKAVGCIDVVSTDDLHDISF